VLVLAVWQLVKKQLHCQGYSSALKNVDQLNTILNEGYWDVFIMAILMRMEFQMMKSISLMKKDRFERVGKYLEIFSNSEYPLANWYYFIRSISGSTICRRALSGPYGRS
jgi:hypothetical protein